MLAMGGGAAAAAPKEVISCSAELADQCIPCVTNPEFLYSALREDDQSGCPPFMGLQSLKTPAASARPATKNKKGPPLDSGGGKVEASGRLHFLAARVLMKILYGARYARPDLLKGGLWSRYEGH